MKASDVDFLGGQNYSFPNLAIFLLHSLCEIDFSSFFLYSDPLTMVIKTSLIWYKFQRYSKHAQEKSFLLRIRNLFNDYHSFVFDQTYLT